MKAQAKPRKKRSTRNVAGYRRFLTKRLLMLTIPTAAISVAIIISALCVNHRNQIRQQQAEADAAYQIDVARFAAVEQDMDAAYAAIVKNVGEPLKHEKTKTCGRPNLKFAEGNLSCRVMLTFSYPEEDSSISISKARSVLTVASNYLSNGRLASNSLENVTVNNNAPHVYTVPLKNTEIENCGMDYSFNKLESTDDNNGLYKFIGLYQIQCSKDVTRAVY
jgi:hypothetical protein